MEDIYKVCCIIDFDGFSIQRYHPDKISVNEFLIREVGFIKIDPVIGDFLAKSFRFDLTFCTLRPGHSSWKSINYQSEKVNGLSFEPQPGEVTYSYNDLHTCIKKIYKLCRTSERYIVAFKGGNCERDLLDELDIPYLDLAAYGCPKYETLMKEKMVFSHLRDCGYHKSITGCKTVVHCPMSEVTAFKDWLLLNYPFTKSPSDGNRDRCGTTVVSSLQFSPVHSSSGRSSSLACDWATGGPSPPTSSPTSPGSGRTGSAPPGP